MNYPRTSQGPADFEKCSFENAAKGNAIYQRLRGEGRMPAAHGVVSFGGGESALLEFATLCLFPDSGFDAGQAALFPFSRGAPSDPARCLGSSFLTRVRASGRSFGLAFEHLSAICNFIPRGVGGERGLH